MADAGQTEFLLVHGAWHGGWAFDPLVRSLEAAGYTARTVDMPSAGSTADLAADAAVVRDALAESSAPTVVVGHSYGGVVISEAAAGAGNVAGLVYLCAFMLDEGESLLGALQGQIPPWIAVDEAAGTSMPTTPVPIFYNDCSEEDAAAAAARLKPQSLAAFTSEQTAAAWKEMPSTYIICEQDMAIPPAAQEAMSARAGAVERMDASHSPFLSQPDATAALLQRAAATVPA
jgi:pimeloyl-ACP methyl ester carboxylesterase